MGFISVFWGVLALLWAMIAFIPLLGWGNWFVIPFAGLGTIVAALGLLFSGPGNRGRAKTGLILNVLAIVIAMFRLSMGGGII